MPSSRTSSSSLRFGAKMKQNFLKFYLCLLWGLNLIAIKTPNLRIKQLKVHWFPLVVCTMRLFSLFIVLTNNLTKLFKATNMSIELVAIVTSTVVAQLISGAAIQVAPMIKTKDTYSFFQFSLSQRPRTNNYGRPAVIASVAAMIVVIVDVIYEFYWFPLRKLKLELFDGTFLSTYLPLVVAVYFIMNVTVLLATPFALSYVVIFGLEFTQHYEDICDELLRLSRATDELQEEERPSIELQILSVKRALKIGKHCHRKYLKTSRIYCFCLLLQCCLMVLNYFAYNISDLESARFDLTGSRYTVLNILLILLLTYTGNTAETRGSRAKLMLLNAKESCIARGNKKIARFIRWAASWNCHLSALGCVDVNYGVISKVFTVVSTYFICYLQMQLTSNH